MQMQDILNVVEHEFNDLNQLIHAQLESRVPLVEKVAEYIINSGGKRVRPLLVILTAKAFAECDERAVKLATVVEFLHTATLLHDDVVDTSDLRRGNPTANAMFGNAPSVLVGDFLYSRSFEMLVELACIPVMTILAKATGIIAEGEVLQLTNVKNPDISEQQYMEVIQGKTAMLFEAATGGMARLIDRNPAECEAMRIYGQQLGLAFQMADDVLDYEGDAEAMGKNVGDDLAEGKTTLPLIHAMQTGSEEQRQLIRSAIRKGGLNDMSEVLSIVQALGSIEYTQSKAQQCINRALAQLEILPESPSRSALEALALLAINRNN
ncbi:MAG TPA: polyprenyl synthetase family protein [Pseudomonadales bacterium]|nr:polyprenyl synthetase family protein [Pseudomonadales bacterium]